MISWFKAGKTLHRRYVWEIVLGCYNALLKEESLTDIVLEENMTCDIIGDIHGTFQFICQTCLSFLYRSILRYVAPSADDRDAIRSALLGFQR